MLSSDYSKKRCCTCGKHKKLKFFHKRSSSKDGRQGNCKRCAKEVHRKFKEEHPEYYKKMRLAALAHYGGKCACCGEDRYEFLAIDHIEGGGGKHRKENKIRDLAKWLFSNNFPSGFQVLCHNCNMAIGFYGYCPHQLEHAKRHKVGRGGKWHRKIRIEALKHYGGVCSCCGERKYKFLAIDHVDGGGLKHHKEHKFCDLARWLWKNNYPKGFRILCHNCNMAIGFYGYCPHKRE